MKKIKTNFLIGKKQIVLSALVLLLGGAVYINYLYANDTENYLATNAMDSNVAQNDSDTDIGKNYGDAQLVSTELLAPSEYFQKASMEKTRSRDEAIETVRSVLQDTNASADELAQAGERIVQITQQIEDESKIENLIKAKGFAECVVYLDNASANIVVKTEGLEVEQAAQIKNIIVSQQNISSDKISIQEVE